ncbi:MAG: hypothetical protein AAGE52_13235 [Myxococcota bacterium]
MTFRSLWVLLVACGSSQDPRGRDAAADVRGDTAVDAAIDTGRDAGTDAGRDSGSDAGTDAEPDARDAQVDTESDALPDAGRDSGEPLSACFDPDALTEGPLCTCADYCWQDPPKGAFTTDAAWGAGGCFWFGGDDGLLRYWDGAETRLSDTLTDAIRDLSGAGPDRVYATTEEGVWHWNGSTWEALPRWSGRIAPPSRVSAVGDRAWVISEERHVSIWDGSDWNVAHLAAGELSDVVAVAANEAYIVSGSRIEHIVDDVVSVVARTRPTFTYDRAWASGTDDVYVSGGAAGHLLHWDGTAWEDIETIEATARSAFLDGTGADDVWMATPFGEVAHWNGDRWIPHPLDAQVHALVVPTSGEAWVLDDHGRKFRWDGDDWAPVESEVVPIIADLWSGDGVTWAVGSETAVFQGGRWTERPISDRGIAVWGFSADDVWVAGSLEVHHWDGGAWTDFPLRNMQGVWGANPDDVWFVGREIHRWNGREMQRASAPAGLLLDVHGTSASDVWAVGQDGLVLRSNGGEWSSVVAPTSASLRAVWARAPDDVWVGGSDGLYRFDGTGWADLTPAARPAIVALGANRSSLWAAQSIRPGRVFEWDGTALVTHEPCALGSITSLWIGDTERWLGTLAGALRAP